MFSSQTGLGFFEQVGHEVNSPWRRFPFSVRFRMRTRQRIARQRQQFSRQFSSRKREKGTQAERGRGRREDGRKPRFISFQKGSASLASGETFTTPKQPLIKRRERRSSPDFVQAFPSSLCLSFSLFLSLSERFSKDLLASCLTMGSNGIRKVAQKDFPR